MLDVRRGPPKWNKRVIGSFLSFRNCGDSCVGCCVGRTAFLGGYIGGLGGLARHGYFSPLVIFWQSHQGGLADPSNVCNCFFDLQFTLNEIYSLQGRL